MSCLRHAAGYVAGILDAEGCVYCKYLERSKRIQRSVGITNTNQTILHATGSYLTELGIEWTLRQCDRKKNPSVHRVCISHRDNYSRLYQTVPIQSVSKAETLKEILLSYHETRRLPKRKRVARHLHRSTGAMRHYLAGMIDGEGHISKSRNRVAITNTDPDIVSATMRILASLGFQRTYCYKKHYNLGGVIKPYYDIRISGLDEMKLLHNIIPLKCDYKIAELEAKI